MPAYTKFLVTYSIVLEHFLLANLEPIDISDTDIHCKDLFDPILTYMGWKNLYHKLRPISA